MHEKISVVINTKNEEKNIEQAIKSAEWADEILICDMHSEDNTVQIAKKLGAKVVFCKKADYVEPVRNFAISQAAGPWILILDADEEIPPSLAVRLKEVAQKMKKIDFVKIPRKNIIFGKWMKASMWWPDLNIRFFRKDKVEWTDKIHRPPKTIGAGISLPEDVQLAIVHLHYKSIPQFLERMTRYTKIQSEELKKGGYKLEWQDFIKKPLGEFLSRFFANRGFEDGLHGLALSLLQASSQLVVYLNIWEMERFEKRDISIDEVKLLREESGKEFDWWISHISKSGFKGFFKNIKEKFK
jgi:glycosyltransferase involved in cell wall biosynthesis